LTGGVRVSSARPPLTVRMKQGVAYPMAIKLDHARNETAFRRKVELADVYGGPRIKIGQLVVRRSRGRIAPLDT